MLKRLIAIFTLSIFMLPLLVQAVGSHDVKHAFQEVFEQSHVEADHAHAGHDHDHNESDHSAFMSLTFFLEDYLHLDLSSGTQKASVKTPVKLKVPAYAVLADSLPDPHVLPTSQVERRSAFVLVPPVDDVYQITQRLRI